MQNSTGTWKVGNLIGQRLTLADGTTNFFLDSSNAYYIMVSANGRQTQYLMYQPSTIVTYPASSPYEIVMASSQKETTHNSTNT